MRVAFFTTRMMLGYGVDLTVHELARRLAARADWQVDVWTPTSDGTYQGQAYHLREIIVYGAPVNRVLPLLECNAWCALRGLRRRLSAAGTSYDVVVPCTHPYYGVGAALGRPSIFFNFGNVPTTGFSLKGRLNWKWLDWSERWHKPRSAAVVSISRFLHEQQPSWIQARGRVIQLGGDHYYPAPAGARERFRAEHGLPPDAVLVGYCGRLHRQHPPYKGTQVVLELGRQLKAADPRVSLVLVGAGSPDDADWVRRYGALPLTNLPPAEMPSFYSALDLYLCASRWEGFNLPIVEAAWHGVPAVAYRAGAHAEHVTTVLVPDGDQAALYTAALELIRDGGRRAELSWEARTRAQAFTWDRTAQEFAALLAEVVR